MTNTQSPLQIHRLNMQDKMKEKATYLFNEFIKMMKKKKSFSAASGQGILKKKFKEGIGNELAKHVYEMAVSGQGLGFETWLSNSIVAKARGQKMVAPKHNGNGSHAPEIILEAPTKLSAEPEVIKAIGDANVILKVYGYSPICLLRKKVVKEVDIFIG